MKKDQTYRSMPFEKMLWQNELEYNRRELAIFESYLLNKGGRIKPYQLTDLMSQLYQYVQSVNKLLEEIRPEARMLPLASNTGPALSEENENNNHYIREEIFYFEQSYRRFRHSFCSFAEGMEGA